MAACTVRHLSAHTMTVPSFRKQLLFPVVLIITFCFSALAYARGGPPPHAGKGKSYSQEPQSGELYLQGITYLSPGHEANSAVLLMPDRRQALFYTGDRVPDTGLQLVDIRVDHIFLEDADSGRVRLDLNDALRFGSDLQQQGNALPMAKGHNWVVKPGGRGRSLRIDPVYENGELLGVRILPSGNGDQYKSSGLKRQDIVLAINGIAMNSADSLDNLQAVLQAQDELQLLVLRERELLRLTFLFRR
jgi:hypothetical protein